MVTGVSNSINTNNLTFSKNAVKYLQDGKLTEDSLGKQVKDSALGSLPFAGIFGVGLPALGARKLAKEKGMKYGDAFKQKIKESSGLATGAPKAPGKIAQALKLDKLGTWFKGTKIGKSGLVKGLSKLNLGSFFAFNMLFSLTEIIPAFKDGGIIAGVKQIGKSALGAGVDALAYAGGMKLGAMIGSAGGPVGAAVGAVVGIVLGGVASTLGAKLCKGIVGKNHSEKKAEQEQNQVAEQIASDDASLAELKSAIEATVAEKAQNGKLTEDDIAILEQAQAIKVSENAQNNQVASNGTQNAQEVQQTQQAQPIGTVSKSQEDTDEQIAARLQKIPENADLGIEYEVPKDYSWTTSV